MARDARRVGAAVLVAGLAIAATAIAAERTRLPVRGQFVGTTGVVRQRTGSDCGLAALMTWAMHRGVPATSYTELLRRYPVPPGGYSLAQLVVIAAHVGLPAEAWQLSNDALDSVPLPVLLHLRSRAHFVVLLARGSTWVVADPAIGLIRTTRREVERAASGAALLATVQPGTPSPSVPRPRHPGA